VIRPFRVTKKSRFALGSSIVAMVVLGGGQARAADATELANVFADCSGVWQAVSIMESRVGRQLSAERYAGLAWAATASAGYILAVDYSARAEDSQQIGSWDSYVEPRASGARLQMLTLIDNQDADRVDHWIGACAATLQTQTQIVRLIRNQMADRN
jgi:hypothetical protein